MPKGKQRSRMRSNEVRLAQLHNDITFVFFAHLSVQEAVLVMSAPVSPTIPPVPPQMPPGRTGDEGCDDIRPVGPNWDAIRRALRLFYFVGKAYMKGANSLTDACKMLEELSYAKRLPHSIPLSEGHVSRILTIARKYFQEVWDMRELFHRRVVGASYSHLTEEGVRAWELTRDYLRTDGWLEHDA